MDLLLPRICRSPETAVTMPATSSTEIRKCIPSGATCAPNEGSTFVVGPCAYASCQAFVVPNKYGSHHDCTCITSHTTSNDYAASANQSERRR